MKGSFRSVIGALIVVAALGAPAPAAASPSCTAHIKNVGAVSVSGVCVVSTPKCATNQCRWGLEVHATATFPTAKGGLVYGDGATVFLPRPGLVTMECAAMTHNGTSASCSNVDPSTIVIRKGDQMKTVCVVRSQPLYKKVSTGSATCRFAHR